MWIKLLWRELWRCYDVIKPLNKNIVEYFFLFPVVQKFFKNRARNTGGIIENKVARFFMIDGVGLLLLACCWWRNTWAGPHLEGWAGPLRTTWATWLGAAVTDATHTVHCVGVDDDHDDDDDDVLAVCTEAQWLAHALHQHYWHVTWHHDHSRLSPLRVSVRSVSIMIVTRWRATIFYCPIITSALHPHSQILLSLAANVMLTRPAVPRPQTPRPELSFIHIHIKFKTRVKKVKVNSEL